MNCRDLNVNITVLVPPYRSTRVNPLILWGSSCTIFCVLRGILSTIVCHLSGGQCIVYLLFYGF